MPRSTSLESEGLHTRPVAGHGEVAAVASDLCRQVSALLGNGLVHPLSQLRLHRQPLGPQTLGAGESEHQELALAGFPAAVHESQQVEGVWLALSPPALHCTRLTLRHPALLQHARVQTFLDQPAAFDGVEELADVGIEYEIHSPHAHTHRHGALRVLRAFPRPEAVADTGYRSKENFARAEGLKTELVVALGREGKQQVQFDYEAHLHPAIMALKLRRMGTWVSP